MGSQSKLNRSVQKARAKPTAIERGRPRDARKGAAIVAAARELFMEHGFNSTSMDAIAKGAGVSKATLYSHFADKESLFRAVVTAISEQVPILPLPAISTESDFRAALESHGVRLLRILTSTEVQNFHRMLMASPAEAATLMPLIFEHGPRRTLEDLAALLEQGRQHGHHSAPDCLLLADQLLSMWKGMAITAQEFGVAPPESPARSRKRIRAAIDLILKAHPAGGT
jgi:TetR/AcrR family transcriptional repressor of mexJK operon